MQAKFLCYMFVAIVLAATLPAAAQQPKKIPTIGILAAGTLSSMAPFREAFQQGIVDLGYVVGKNIQIEYRYADGKLERLPELAAELVRLRVDVIAVGGTPAVAAAKQATSTIPIVAGSAGDLVGAGLVASLARPGGNVTGSTNVDPDLSGKRLELLKEVFPKLSRVAVLLHDNPGDQDELRETQTVARTFAVQIQSLEVNEPNQFQSVYAEMTKKGAHALIILNSTFTSIHRKQLMELSAKHRLPSMCGPTQYTDAGCLISYGPDPRDNWRRAATYIDKILKGAKPADLPVEQPKKYHLVINLKTAKQIGLTIPPNVLARADRVIR